MRNKYAQYYDDLNSRHPWSLVSYLPSTDDPINPIYSANYYQSAGPFAQGAPFHGAVRPRSLEERLGSLESMIYDMIQRHSSYIQSATTTVADKAQTIVTKSFKLSFHQTLAMWILVVLVGILVVLGVVHLATRQPQVMWYPPPSRPFQ